VVVVVVVRGEEGGGEGGRGFVWFVSFAYSGGEDGRRDTGIG